MRSMSVPLVLDALLLGHALLVVSSIKHVDEMINELAGRNGP
jgi:hypothetical protein